MESLKTKTDWHISSLQEHWKGCEAAKRPPEAEDLDNENTHHQRAHIKNMKKMFFSSNHPEGATSSAVMKAETTMYFCVQEQL